MGKHVLLIEDEPNINEALRFILGREGWQVTAHDQGTDAIEVIRETRPDLLILDVMLPGRSGFDILRELRDDPVLGPTPVLMLTAKGQGRDREQAEQFGVSRFMTKPFANAEFLTSVRELLGVET
jgi:two-component system, OmpR family, response regulator